MLHKSQAHLQVFLGVFHCECGKQTSHHSSELAGRHGCADKPVCDLREWWCAGVLGIVTPELSFLGTTGHRALRTTPRPGVTPQGSGPDGSAFYLHFMTETLQKDGVAVTRCVALAARATVRRGCGRGAYLPFDADPAVRRLDHAHVIPSVTWEAWEMVRRCDQPRRGLASLFTSRGCLRQWLVWVESVCSERLGTLPFGVSFRPRFLLELHARWARPHWPWQAPC